MIQAEIQSTACLTTPLQNKLQEKLHRVIPVLSALCNTSFKAILHNLLSRILECEVRSLGIGTLFYSNWIGKCANTQWTHFRHIQDGPPTVILKELEIGTNNWTYKNGSCEPALRTNTKGYYKLHLNLMSWELLNQW